MAKILLGRLDAFNRDQLLTSKFLDLEVETPPSSEHEGIL